MDSTSAMIKPAQYLAALLISFYFISTSAFLKLQQGIPSRHSLIISATSNENVDAPAKTFLECTRQAIAATRRALNDGNKLLEVEFPPLPLDYLEDSSSSARAIADANTRWAIEFAQGLADLGKIAIIYPDKAELNDAVMYANLPGGVNPFPNVTLATIRTDSIDNAQTLDQIFSSIFGATIGGTVDGVPNAALYVALISSTQELPDLQKLHKLNPNIPIVFFNLKLDFLRGDLGLPLFPGRDLHYQFLSRIKPAYLMRSRAFATSLPKPPFIINYSGLLYRAYPYKYQSILNIGDGRNKVVAYSDTRPSTAQFKEDLTGALRIPGVSSEDLKKTRSSELWWEKSSEKEVSDAWRT